MNRIPPAERRRRLLDAAFTVISERGVAAATTRAVSAEAGMPLASFHYVFSSQRELMEELIRTVTLLETEAVTLNTVGDGPGDDVESSTRAMFNSYLDFLFANAGEEQAFIELHQYALRTPGMEDLAKLRHEASRQVVGVAIGKLTERFGTPRVPVEQLITEVVIIAEGLTMFWLATRDDEATRQAARRFASFIAAVAGPEPGQETSS